MAKTDRSQIELRLVAGVRISLRKSHRECGAVHCERQERGDVVSPTSGEYQDEGRDWARLRQRQEDLGEDPQMP
jgi:hypothetical protein